MKIAVLAHLRHPIAPPFAGGIEAHTHHLVRGLLSRGHDVDLFASGDSDPAFRVIPVLGRHYDADFDWHVWKGTDALTAYLDDAHGRALRQIAEGVYDVVHNNGLHRFPPRAARALRLPMVTSLHVPPFHPLDRAVADGACPWHVVTAPSRVQLRRWLPEASPEGRVVPNGIDPSRWPFGAGSAGGVVWAGRISPLKGPHLAIDAARRAGMAITLAGPCEDRAYFRGAVAPRLGAGARYAGALAQTGLADLMGGAAVFVFTPLWDEPFGLTAVEAMACGTPVAAFASGAAAEVLGEGAHLAAPGDALDLARAIGAAAGRGRQEVRDFAAGRYGIDAMLDAYEGSYAQARAGLGQCVPARTFAPHELSLASCASPPPRLPGPAPRRAGGPYPP